MLATSDRVDCSQIIPKVFNWSLKEHYLSSCSKPEIPGKLRRLVSLRYPRSSGCQLSCGIHEKHLLHGATTTNHKFYPVSLIFYWFPASVLWTNIHNVIWLQRMTETSVTPLSRAKLAKLSRILPVQVKISIFVDLQNLLHFHLSASFKGVACTDPSLFLTLPRFVLET